jgi:hypothetical protein
MTFCSARLGRSAFLAGCSAAALTAGLAPANAGKVVNLFSHNALIVSSTTYERTKGAIASLVAGTSVLPSKATSTTTAVAGNNYVTTWNNASVDASYGVSSPIRLQEFDAASGTLLQTFNLPPEEVVTSFSSKSELGLHVVNNPQPSVIFVGYGLANVGAIDVSDSDAVPGQDPTNPVTFWASQMPGAPAYAFPRTIVALDRFGNFTFTPTTAYGGNNGRSALLAKNGLYYAVGNSNNGSASTFGPNGTNPDVTQTTGVEVVSPLNAKFASAAPASSAEIDPLLQFTFNGKADKPGKDDNFRGITEYKGQLYFTKGSGSNGIDTVYTVAGEPTLAKAGATPISIVPGFPTDQARATGGDFTPFAVFFANPKTMYVTDEGTGGTADAAHAGLEKWSLGNDGIWKLDYVLQAGLIGTVDSGLIGPDGQYPDVTTIGLRNLAGVLNDDGTVTLWAVTSTSSASGDNGADPNKVVKITDLVYARTVTPEVAAEQFETVLGPTYGTAYRGVGYLK